MAVRYQNGYLRCEPRHDGSAWVSETQIDCQARVLQWRNLA